MKTPLNMRASLTTASDLSAGAWTTVQVVLNAVDATGVYMPANVAIGDVLMFDTSAFSAGTVSKYIIASIVSAVGPALTVTATYAASNAPEPAPDLSYAEGTVGILSRPTATKGYTILPSPSLQQVPEALITASINSDNISISDPASGGVGSATNLGYTAAPANGTVTSSTGTSATLPAADGTNAGLMTPAQVTKLAGIAPSATAVTVANNLTTAVAGSALDATQGKALKDTADALATTVAGKQATLVSGTSLKTVNSISLLGSGNVAVATAAQGVKADAALQPGELPAGTTLPAAQISDSTVSGRALLTAADSSAQLTALGAQAALVSGVSVKTVGGSSLLGSGDISLASSAYGNVSATPVVIDLSALRIVGTPHTLVIVPDTGCTIQVEHSNDGGSSYTVQESITAQTTYGYVLSVGETPTNMIRLTRTVGTSTASTYSIR